jgi:hypothetical protein
MIDLKKGNFMGSGEMYTANICGQLEKCKETEGRGHQTCKHNSRPQL